MQVLGGLGVSANLLVVGVLAVTGAITRDTHTGLLVHQAAVDCARAAILFPLGQFTSSSIAYMSDYVGRLVPADLPAGVPQVFPAGDRLPLPRHRVHHRPPHHRPQQHASAGQSTYCRYCRYTQITDILMLLDIVF